MLSVEAIVRSSKKLKGKIKTTEEVEPQILPNRCLMSKVTKDCGMQSLMGKGTKLPLLLPVRFFGVMCEFNIMNVMFLLYPHLFSESNSNFAAFRVAIW